MAKQQKNNSTLVQPLVRVNEQQHELEKLLEAGEAPTLKSIGYAKISQNKMHSWVSYVVTTRGKEVISIEISEPDMRDIAEESSKINFVNCFVDQGL